MEFESSWNSNEFRFVEDERYMKISFILDGYRFTILHLSLVRLEEHRAR